ncbi:MAG: phage tail assembly chaperone [Erythrobacter sp.]|nr:phage tail assembly chaperone [Erythrobacter sp.]
MTDGFGGSATRWFNVAARLLGWSPNEFWQATPEELLMTLRDPEPPGMSAGPSRELIAQLMERDKDG